MTAMRDRYRSGATADDTEALVRAWRAASERLPAGWRLDGMRCTSTGLAPGERGERWRAVAARADGSMIEAVADDPLEALDELVRQVIASGAR